VLHNITRFFYLRLVFGEGCFVLCQDASPYSPGPIAGGSFIYSSGASCSPGLVLQGSWTIRTSLPNLRPGLDYTLVVVWTRALYTGLVLRDSRTIRRSPQNLCPGLDYALVADRTIGQDGLLGTLVLTTFRYPK